MDFLVVIEKGEDGDGYYAYCPQIPGCTSHGDSVEDLRENMKEAIRAHLDLMKETGEEIPEAHDLLLSTVSV